MMSVYYALPDDLKKDSLVKIANLAENDAVLAVSDYVSLREDTEPLIDFSETPMLPVEINQLKNSFKETGWELVTEIDISDKYDEWYSEFLAKMLEKKSELLLDFTEEAFNQVTDTFTTILNKIKNKTWGGKIFYAKLNKQIGFFQPHSGGNQADIKQEKIESNIDLNSNLSPNL
jgi:hypothetical protein